MSTVSCASRSKLNQYGKEIDEIRKEVKTIRLLTDEMKYEIVNMKTSLVAVDDSVKQQSVDIEAQRQYQGKLQEMVGNIKDAVVKLESENLPTKKEELDRLERDSRSNAELRSGFVIKTEQDGAITKIYTEKVPDVDAGKKDKSKTRAYGIEEESKSGFGYAVKDGVILWMAPSKNSDVMEILGSWQQLTILSKLDNEGIHWLKVKTNDYTGYVNTRFVIISD